MRAQSTTATNVRVASTTAASTERNERMDMKLEVVVLTLAELMARLGHSTAGAALRYQHAPQDRDREIAALLSKLA